MKSFTTAICFLAPFMMNAQEPAKETKTTTTKPAPSAQKSISEKGVSSSKGKGVILKKAEPTNTVNPVAVDTKEVAPADQTKTKSETKNP